MVKWDPPVQLVHNCHDTSILEVGRQIAQNPFETRTPTPCHLGRHTQYKDLTNPAAALRCCVHVMIDGDCHVCGGRVPW